MVKLVLDDLEQISFLEMELDKRGIEYQKISNKNHIPPLEVPFLLVDGVPLDFNRALKWLRGQDKYE